MHILHYWVSLYDESYELVNIFFSARSAPPTWRVRFTPTQPQDLVIVSDSVGRGYMCPPSRTRGVRAGAGGSRVTRAETRPPIRGCTKPNRTAAAAVPRQNLVQPIGCPLESH